MIFTQPVFFLFFALVFGVHWALRTNRSRKLLLLAASYFFYGYWDYRFLGLILLSTSIDYATGIALSRSESPGTRRALIVVSLGANLGILGFFKYFGFFVASAGAFLTAIGAEPDLPTLRVVLPVGVSFFTFQSLSYTIDVYRKELAAERSFFDFALFVSFFPQLVAGPIVRAKRFLPQLSRTQVLASIDVRGALLLFLLGYFKKACLADNIAPAIDPLFADPTAYDAVSRVLGASLYSVQIYCDFSGYSDMAIASAALLGYELTRNFDAPYLSRNIREFWQRWHISLSTWLRDYLYVPLGGNRGGEAKTTRNLLVTMLLGGLWHGANWTFVLWGLLHGMALVTHRWYRSSRPAGAHPGTVWGERLSWALTLAWVVACFAVFRSPDIHTAFELFAGSTAPGSSAHLSLAFFGLVFLLGAAQSYVWRRQGLIRERLARAPDSAFYPVFGATAAVLVLLTPLNAAPFIYFQF